MTVFADVIGLACRGRPEVAALTEEQRKDVAERTRAHPPSPPDRRHWLGCPIECLAWQRMTAVESPRTDLEPLLSVKKVAECLGISESGVYRLCKAGELVGVKVGGRTLFEPREVRQFIEASRRQVTKGATPSSTKRPRGD